MALRRCPECKKKISDTSDTCIHCGYKLKRNIGEDYYDTALRELDEYDPPYRKVLKIICVVFGSLLAIAALALLIITFIKYEDWGFSKSAIMEAVAVVSLVGGFTLAVLCGKLL